MWGAAEAWMSSPTLWATVGALGFGLVTWYYWQSDETRARQRRGRREHDESREKEAEKKGASAEAVALVEPVAPLEQPAVPAARVERLEASKEETREERVVVSAVAEHEERTVVSVVLEEETRCAFVFSFIFSPLV